MTKDRSIPQEFVITIPMRDEHGAVVGEKQFIAYAGLLALAHDIGVEQIHSTLLQVPTDNNGMTAIVRAVVQGKRGTYSGLGDASPQSVNRKVARHLIRVAETRAKARALRDFTNVGLVALEELGDDEYDTKDVRPSAHIVRIHAPARTATQPITDAQRRALFRKALARGIEGNDASAYLTRRLGTAVERATKEQASKLLDDLTREERVAPDGGGHAAE